ncbi:hypothetical protein J1605_006444 [Eschrichtius robustus]|uniref:Uncharacterized protein n=1 Tax=Eschrichtius robustus TaxID=9764 RepID=A0AB34H3L9_ESCRO|nr:hypothetical protein J1605_006444 [Eschrichtius robustus]
MEAASPAGQPRHRDAGPLTSPDSPGNELFNNLRREESPRSPRLGGHQARPGSAGAPPVTLSQASSGQRQGGAGSGWGPPPASASGCPFVCPRPWRRRAGPGLLETPVCGRGGRRPPSKARRGRERELEAAGAGPRQPDRAACFVASEPSRSFSKTTRPRGQSPVSGKAAPQELKPQDRAREAPDPQAGREAVNAGAERKLAAGPRSEPRLAGRWSFRALRKAGLTLPTPVAISLLGWASESWLEPPSL